MRLAWVLPLAALLFVLVPVAVWPAAPARAKPAALPTFRQAQDWRITYVMSEKGAAQAPAPTATVAFRRPDSMWVEAGGQQAFTAVADAESARIYFPTLGFAMWIPGAYAPELPFPGLDLILGGPAGPITADWSGIAAALRAGEAKGNVVYTRLPDTVIAKRRCVGVRTTINVGGSDTAWITDQWFDWSYGVPLGATVIVSDIRTSTRATAATFNSGASAARFALKIPASVPIFKGPLDFDDVDMLALYVKGDAVPDREPTPLLETTAVVLRPASAPPGFSGPFQTVTGVVSDANRSWYFAGTWLSKSGGVVIFTQGIGDFPAARPLIAGDTQTATLRGQAAQVVAYHQPFEGLILTWENGERHYRLEGTGATRADLEAMAEGMKEVTVSPQEEGQQEPAAPEAGPRESDL